MTGQQYVDQVLGYLPSDMPSRQQIALELRGDIADRIAAGEHEDDVVRHLGAPRALAESYLAEIPLVAAGYGARILAKLVDLALLVAVMASLGWWLSRGEGENGIAWLAIVVLGPMLLYALYTVIAEARFGRTIGKDWFDLRVVRESGVRISMGQAIVRQLPTVFQVLWLDALFALFTEHRQRAFELLSRTRVVREHVDA